MSATRIVYLCEHCLTASASDQPCEGCGGPMLRCDAGEAGSEQSKPLYNEDGSLRTHAPRWWLERHHLGEAPDAKR